MRVQTRQLPEKEGFDSQHLRTFFYPEFTPRHVDTYAVTLHIREDSHALVFILPDGARHEISPELAAKVIFSDWLQQKTTAK